MTSSELRSIKESIEKIEKFQYGYPRLIDDVDEKWLPYFAWQAEECFRRRNGLSPENNSEAQMNLL